MRVDDGINKANERANGAEETDAGLNCGDESGLIWPPIGCEG